MINLKVNHTTKIYEVQVDSNKTVGELMTTLARVTGVPVNAQKLIYKGKQISADQSISILQAGLVDGGKVMVLGKKYDPSQEAAYKDITNLETKALLVETKYIKVCEELSDIEKGFLDANLVNTALKSLEKRANGNNEELHKILASLDTVHVESDQTEIRDKRKSTATKVNKIMDNNDALLEKIKQLVRS